MPIALDPKRIERYVLKCDRELPVEKQTVWLLRPLKVREMAAVKNEALVMDQKTQELRSHSGTSELTIVQRGLVGVENFKDADGVDVKFLLSGGVVADAFLDRLANDWRVELSNAISRLSEVLESDRGN